MQSLGNLAVVIRADASVQIGSGHVMRCLTLADELRERGAAVVFVCRNFEGNLRKHIEAKGYECVLLPVSTQVNNVVNTQNKYDDWLGDSPEHDAEATATVCAEFAARHGGTIHWLIIDHYAIDERWESRLRPLAQRIMAIDDIANRRHDCDVLLDQNLYDNAEQRYIGLVPTHCTMLLGPTYALLRPEFREARALLGERLIRSGEVRRIMIFFGGSDPTNETAKAVHAVQMLNRPDIDVDVIVGIANPHRNEIEQLCAQTSNVHFYCQVPNMAEFMVKADLALGAGGSTTWERCCLGLPTIVVIIAENQVEMTEAGARRGVVWNAGNGGLALSVESLVRIVDTILKSQDVIAEASFHGQMLVDGAGTDRVVRRVLHSHSNIFEVPSSLRLRKATKADVMLYFAWANDPDVRRNAFNQEAILLESHQSWFLGKLASNNSYLYILESNGIPAGQIRFDCREPSVAEIDFSVAPEFRGQGLGMMLIQCGVASLSQVITTRPLLIQGAVKRENIASCKAFLRAGFEEEIVSDTNLRVRYFYRRIEE
jgi:UDP-2,4-diacetamido-2,4,6-trideoxy-beta-L-altropyranose hydrolase